MKTQFVEVTDGGAYGKFLVCRLTADEVLTESAMPEAPQGQALMSYAGQRRFSHLSTLVIDLQLGQAAAWFLQGGEHQYERELHEHHQGLRVCPLYHEFVKWLYRKESWAMGAGEIQAIPRYIDLREE